MTTKKPIIAIDGPAGSGKSTVTRRVAQELGLLHLDTGAMYRAVTWLVMDQKIDIQDGEAIAVLVQEMKLNLVPRNTPHLPSEVYINDHEVTKAIRTPEVTSNVSAIAAQAAVRAELVKLQKNFGKQGGVIAEGRDIGTNVFPEAELKIFLTATAPERARRRLLDLKNQGYENVNLESLIQEIVDRDEQDTNRAISPLRRAKDAQEIVTDNFSIEEVISQVVAFYNQLVPN